MKSGKAIITVFAALIFAVGGLLSSCLNPVGFPISLNVNGEVDVNTKDPDKNKPGVTSPDDDPNKRPTPDVGVLVLKNLTGGAKAIAATFAITGQTKGTPPVAISETVALDAGHERSKTLLPSNPDGYKITIKWTEAGTEKSAVISKVLLPGRVEYVYFYFGKDGEYHGGGDSNEVYINIDWSYYSDNENKDDNKDSNNESQVQEGDSSSHSRNNPRTKLPRDKEQNYGLLLVHNVTASMNLYKATFDRTQADPYKGAHYETNPGPAHGVVQSIVLRAGTWDIAGFWPGVDTGSVHASRGGVPDNKIKNFVVRSYAANPGNNHVWFYRGTDNHYYMTDNPDPSAWVPPYGEFEELPPDNGGGGGGGGNNGEEEGSIPGIINDGNKNSLGVLIVRNLSSGSHEANLTSVNFLKYSPSRSFNMIPGPANGKEKSILLGPGDWDITGNYTVVDGGATGTKNTVKNVMPASLLPQNYVFFYWSTSGVYKLSPANSVADIADLDASNSENTMGDGDGLLVITNASVAGSQIVQTKWNDLVYSTQIMPGNSKSIALPAGTSNLSFRISSKTTFGTVMTETIRAGQTTNITYTDDFENIVSIPPGFGLLRIENRSSNVVRRLVMYDRAGAPNPYENTAFEPPGPISKDSAASKIIPNGYYIAHVEMDNIAIERVVRLADNIELVQITEADINNGGGTVPLPEGNPNGGLQVINGYTGVLPMKIFKIYLYSAAFDAGTNTYDYGNGYVDPADPQYPRQPAGTPGPYRQTYAPGYLEKGQVHDFAPNIVPGYYKLLVVAGVYTWELYANGENPTGKLQLSQKLITYDCGNIFIPGSYRVVYNFSVTPGTEADMAGSSPVFVSMSHSGVSGSFPIVYLEITLPPKAKRDLHTSNPASGATGYLNALHFTGITNTRLWPGIWTIGGASTHVSTPRENIVYSNGTVINSSGAVNQVSFYLPPGTYWARYIDGALQGVGYRGVDNRLWLRMDLRAAGGQRVYMSGSYDSGLSYFF